MAYTKNDLERMKKYFGITPEEANQNEKLNTIPELSDNLVNFYSHIHKKIENLKKEKLEYTKYIKNLEKLRSNAQDIRHQNYLIERLAREHKNLERIDKRIDEYEKLLITNWGPPVNDEDASKLEYYLLKHFHKLKAENESAKNVAEEMMNNYRKYLMES